MPVIPTTGIQIDEVEAEITGAARDAQKQMARPTSPDAENAARQIREALARETWRALRLSTE
jgi:hypothetical protein